jgi:hypothetical protein
MRFLRIDDSSNVEAVGYDPKALALEVKFKGGGHYRYEQCSNTQFVELACADSVGKQLHAEFVSKKIAHPCTKIADAAAAAPEEKP